MRQWPACRRLAALLGACQEGGNRGAFCGPICDPKMARLRLISPPNPGVSISNSTACLGPTPRAPIDIRVVLGQNEFVVCRDARSGGIDVVTDLLKRITVNPAQCGGRPCIRGMRIRVTDVLDLLAQGLSSEELLSEMPDLEPQDIVAALQYASRKIDHPVLAA